MRFRFINFALVKSPALFRLIEAVKETKTELQKRNSLAWQATPNAPAAIPLLQPEPQNIKPRVVRSFQQFALAALLTLGTDAKAGIPEPDLVWYGKVLSSSGETTARLTTGLLVWRVEPVNGGASIVLSAQLTNINHQFSFLLRVPCETPEPNGSVASNVVKFVSPPSRYRRMTVTLDGQPLTLISAAPEISPTLADRGRCERIDLRLGTAPIDSDGDGLADAWELEHFGNLNADGNGDPDGDRVNNLREYRAGTDPNDPSSRFEVVEVTKVANGISISWSSQPDRRYRIRRSFSLLVAPTQYGVIQEGIAATPPLNQFIDTTASATASGFYLIEIEE